MKKHRDEFIADLTPEEMAIYDEQCEEGLWREAYKRMKQKIMSELRRRKKSGEVQVSEKELDDLFDTLKDDDKDA